MRDIQKIPKNAIIKKKCPYNFLTINSYENLHEYFFVQNQILNIRNEKGN